MLDDEEQFSGTRDHDNQEQTSSDSDSSQSSQRIGEELGHSDAKIEAILDQKYLWV
jgi:hypothetical protein